MKYRATIHSPELDRPLQCMSNDRRRIDEFVERYAAVLKTGELKIYEASERVIEERVIGREAA